MFCLPFWHLLPRGGKFKGFKINIFSSSCCHSCISTLVIYYYCMDESCIQRNLLLVYVNQYMQWHSKFIHKFIYYGGVYSIYYGCTIIKCLCSVLMILQPSQVYNLSLDKFHACLKIHYINPLVEIVINYQNGGDWKYM